MPSSAQKSEVTSSLSKLSLDGDKKKATGTKAKAKQPVLDSWEDDDDEEEEGEEQQEGEEDAKPQNDGAKAPPPTPISPTYGSASRSFPPYDNTNPTGPPTQSSGPGAGARRPEKTDAVARRMIASALGVKVPKQTEEQKAYQKAIREQERKRREEEKEAEKRKQEETERAKAAIWND
ncbi:hypothetical protein CSOJ01_00039 [Colletotrichum sojae]|uniref:Ubiquitin-like protein smt3 n=1 Tax=Colletotrichum sojae TaxID=2175907 RepID=A0A8H6N6S1_9PEZI|nr:hypothetical protein CSOJ01_00039 [Colletotrichum sojae]